MSNYLEIGYYVNEYGSRYCTVYTKDFWKVLELQETLKAENEYFRACDMIEVVSEEDVDAELFSANVWQQVEIV
jgi:hypothetical protein